MFIIKFNRMIHNKWLWGAFATVVVIAFAGSDLISARSGAEPREGIGLLDGENVSFREYDLLRQQLQMENPRGVAEGPELEEAVWQRLAALRTAKRLGIRVADEEILEMLRRDPAFHGAEGRFDPMLYRTVLENALGMSPDAYQEIRRNQMTLAKIEHTVSAAAWGVPSVAQEQGRGMTDRFTVRVVAISNTFSSADVSLPDEELEAFYRERLATYRIPDQVSVRYAVFPVTDHMDAVKVAEDDLRDYYDANIDRYRVGTNQTAQSFEQVRELVERELRLQGARELAADAAADFADWFYSGDEVKRPEDFERLAMAQGVTVRTTGWFSADAAPLGVDPSSSFVTAAFDLEEDPLRNQFSDAVVGRTACYVLALQGRQSSRDPALAEVESRVREEAQAFNRNRLFWELVEKVRATVETEMGKGRPLDEALAAFDVQAGTNQVLTALDAYQSLPGGETLATRMIRMGAGELSPAVPDGDGAVFLQVLQREPGEEIQRQVVSSQMAGQLRNRIGELVLEDWRRFNLASMSLVTARRTAEAESEDDAAEEP